MKSYPRVRGHRSKPMGASVDSLPSFSNLGVGQSNEAFVRASCVKSVRKSLGALIAALALVPAFGFAAPLVFEETAKIASPDPAFHVFPLRMAVEGDTIIATGVKY